jgi:hypothetical protein
VLGDPDWVMAVEPDEVVNIGVDWWVVVDDQWKVQLINVEKPESQYS